LVSFSRQGVVNFSHHSQSYLYSYGGEHSIIVYGIISKTLILHSSRSWITQGFIPIAGYNYGAENYERVKSKFQLNMQRY
jgi:hypothetical protein